MTSVKHLTLIGLAAALSAAVPAGVDLYSNADLQQTSHALAAKGTAFAGKDLARYSNHYTMLAFRSATGSAEVHEHEADVFFAKQGTATIVLGGKVVNPHTEKPGEIRGTSLDGGERHPFAAGDVIHIPAGVPHRLLIEPGKTFTYFVVKVTGQ